MGLLQWGLVALAISLIAGLLGLTSSAHAIRQIAKALFGFFLTLALIMLVMVVLGIGASSAP